MNKHRVVVTGQIDPNKVMKKLKKKTGKKVEIVENRNNNEEAKNRRDEMGLSLDSGLILMNPFQHEVDGYIKNEVLMMFNDDNPNACVIM